MKLAKNNLKKYSSFLIPKFVKESIKNLSKRLSKKKFFNESPVISKELLKAAIIEVGIKRGDTIFVHSSLKGLGVIDGGVNTILDILEEVVGNEGNIIMPAFTMQKNMYETLTDREFLFDVRVTDNISTGIISKTFAKERATARSLHPTHSVACKGIHADWLSSYDEIILDNFGKSGPFGKAMQLNAKILGIGVNFKPVTFYHVFEDYYPEYFEGCYLPNTFKASIKNAEGNLSSVELKCHNPDYHNTRIEKVESIHEYFRDQLTSQGVATVTNLGLGQVWSMPSTELFDFLHSEFRKGKTIYKI